MALHARVGVFKRLFWRMLVWVGSVRRRRVRYKHVMSIGIVLVWLGVVLIILDPMVRMINDIMIANNSSSIIRRRLMVDKVAMAQDVAYNDRLLKMSMNERKLKLNMKGNNKQVGVIVIPTIGLISPINTSIQEVVLEQGVSVLPGTSLPVGGNGVHSVITGHSYMLQNSFFTHLDQIKIGDTFRIETHDQILHYRVVKRWIQSDHNLSRLYTIWKNKDIVSLMTCTGLGNNQRLVVQGVRSEEVKSNGDDYRFWLPVAPSDIISVGQSVGFGWLINFILVFACNKRRIMRVQHSVF